jgi:tripartite-type tricarboxylate transporter receptor subunit TctC
LHAGKNGDDKAYVSRFSLDIQKQLNDRGQIPVVSPPPAELEAFVTNEMKRWGDIVRASGQAGSL